MAAVPLHRLISISPQELEQGELLFALAGGDAGAVAVDEAIELLSQTGLPQDLLELAALLSDAYGAGELDLESFLVFCRLCAHAQQAKSSKKASKAISEKKVAEQPVVPVSIDGIEATSAPRGVDSTAVAALGGGMDSSDPYGGFDMSVFAQQDPSGAATTKKKKKSKTKGTAEQFGDPFGGFGAGAFDQQNFDMGGFEQQGEEGYGEEAYGQDAFGPGAFGEAAFSPDAFAQDSGGQDVFGGGTASGKKKKKNKGGAEFADPLASFEQGSFPETLDDVRRGSFDFDAIAFGTGDLSRPSKKKPDVISLAPIRELAALPRGRSSLAGKTPDLQAPGPTKASDGLSMLPLRPLELYSDPQAPVDGESSAAILLEAIRRDEETAKKPEPGKSPPQATLLRNEQVQERKLLDHGLIEKRRLETAIHQTHARVKTRREERQHVAISLAQRQSDVQHLFDILDFLRSQIEEVSREVGRMREARQAFSAEDTHRIAEAFVRFERQGVRLHEREGALTAAHRVQGKARQDLLKAAELAEETKNMTRWKAEMQSRQQLLLDTHLQREEERDLLQKIVEAESEALQVMRSDRLRLAKERNRHLEEILDHAKVAGIPPRALEDSFAINLSGPPPNMARQPVPGTQQHGQQWGVLRESRGFAHHNAPQTGGGGSPAWHQHQLHVPPPDVPLSHGGGSCGSWTEFGRPVVAQKSDVPSSLWSAVPAKDQKRR